MKIGLSSYSLVRALQSKEMTILDLIDWVADRGGQHVEIIPVGFDLTGNFKLASEIRQKAADARIDISNYAISANFIKDTELEYEQEIQRVMKEVDIANELGARLLRHDVAVRSDTSIQQFHSDLNLIAEACRRISEYADQYNIITSVENHGYYVQASDRVQLLIHTVGRPNFKTTLDVGNFMCIDEDPVLAVKKNISYASMIHIKDFYVRASYRNPGAGWFQTASGNYLRGSIIGHGDLNLWEILRIIKNSGYDGYLSIEFEGMEDPKLGSQISLENTERILREV